MLRFRFSLSYLFLFTLLSILGCSSDDGSDIPLAENTFEAQKDDVLWEGSTELQLMENDTLVFLAIGEGLDNGVLMIKVKFEGEGSYTLAKENGLYYDTLGGDAIVAQYTLQEPETAIFVVESYDQSSETLTGSFELELFPEAQINKSIEYMLRITEGRFKGTLTEVP
ncbi:hypothetical protein J4E06_01655 [Muricauda sp. NFXS6]|uniref:hypothetical protein n=1 Tax=Allomuricauda sp. NFXS6 TaxID=2819094 RepID=UPI0032DE382A